MAPQNRQQRLRVCKRNINDRKSDANMNKAAAMWPWHKLTLEIDVCGVCCISRLIATIGYQISQVATVYVSFTASFI